MMKILSYFSMLPLLMLLSLPQALFAQASFAQELDPRTGLIIDSGFELVKAHCTACHSAKLVTQNRMSRDSWLETIRWMQASQGLWALGDAEGPILDYLAKHYFPLATGRRKALPPELMPPT